MADLARQPRVLRKRFQPIQETRNGGNLWRNAEGMDFWLHSKTIVGWLCEAVNDFDAVGSRRLPRT
jgi:hypothetical protein